MGNKTLDITDKKDCFVLCDVCTHPIAHCSTDHKKTLCPRCGHKQRSTALKSTGMSLSLAFTALILYFPANIFPFMTLEMYGNKTESTIWSGIVTLSHGNNWPLAVIVFIASMLIPFIKLLVLFYLGLYGHNGKNKVFKTKLYHFVELIGPWSMLDIFLLAVLIAILKFGSMASSSAGMGSFVFLAVVICTMLSSAMFDPKIIWQEDRKETYGD